MEMEKDVDQGLPDFDANGNFPPGIYRVSLREVEQRLAWNERRRGLFSGLEQALNNLFGAGVERVWIDGSFVTAKEEPGDIDGCWEYTLSVDVDRLDTVFLELDPPREAMKEKYGTDFLISGTTIIDAGGQPIEEFFQIDRNGNRKGILVIDRESQR